MKIIAEMPKNPLEKIIASFGEYKGQPRIDLRIFFKPEVVDPDRWIPTRKGLSLPLDNWLEFKKLIKQVDKTIPSQDETGHC